MEWFSWRKRYSYWVECLEDLKNRQVFSEQYPDWEEGLKKGKVNLARVDKWRKNENTLNEIYLKNNQKVYDWWNRKLI